MTSVGYTSRLLRCATTSATCAASAPGDSQDIFVINEEGHTARAPRGASDAFLTPHHVERGKIFVRSRCAHIGSLDGERIARAPSSLPGFRCPKHLSHTVAGKQWVANLYAHVFVEEHERGRPGPQRATS